MLEPPAEQPLAALEHAVVHPETAETAFSLRLFELDMSRALVLGGKVWDAANVLAGRMLQHPDEYRAATALELGSGLGLAGLVLARFAQRVVLTDHEPAVLEPLRRNAAAPDNAAAVGFRAGEPPEVRELDWHAVAAGAAREPWAPLGGFELIVGADCVYEETHSALAHVFDRYLAPGGRAELMSPFQRPGLGELLAQLDALGLEHEVEVMPMRNTPTADNAGAPSLFRRVVVRRP